MKIKCAFFCRLYILVGSFLLFIKIGVGQEVKIYGQILFASDSTAVVGATVKLENTTGKLVAGTSTGANGDFAIIGDTDKISRINISHIGYKPLVFELTGCVKEDLSLGTLYLQEDSKVLDDVVVEGKTNRIDRMLRFPRKEELDRSYDFMSLLQTMDLRGLSVDLLNKTASVRGGDVQWQVNGVPRSVQDVQSIDPNQILRIEYSDVVSARYLDRGIGGVVNVILKECLYGGSVWADVESAVTTRFVNGSGGTRYDRGHHSFTLDYKINFRDYRKRLIFEEREFIGDDFKVNRVQTPEESPFGYTSQNITTSYLYQPNNKRQFSATLRNGFLNVYNNSTSLIRQSNLAAYRRQDDSRNVSYTPAVDLYFANIFSNGDKLEAYVVASYSNVKRTLLDDWGESQRTYNSPVDVNRTAIIGEIVYNHQFNKAITLSSGVQHTTAYSLNKYAEQTDNLLENNSYIFANTQGQLGRFQYSIGTGIKLLNVMCNSQDLL